jgi:hypothetical protein
MSGTSSSSCVNPRVAYQCCRCSARCRDWSRRLSRSALEPPPLALGGLRDHEPARWELRSKFPAATADRAIRLTVGEAALALAHRVDGVVIDSYGFPVTRPEDLLPR